MQSISDINDKLSKKWIDYSVKPYYREMYTKNVSKAKKIFRKSVLTIIFMQKMNMLDKKYNKIFQIMQNKSQKTRFLKHYERSQNASKL